MNDITYLKRIIRHRVSRLLKQNFGVFDENIMVFIQFLKKIPIFETFLPQNHGIFG